MWSKSLKAVPYLAFAVAGMCLALTRNFVGCIYLSIGVFVYPFVVALVKWLYRNGQAGISSRQRAGAVSVAMEYILCFVIAACLLRYAVNGLVLSYPTELKDVAASLGLDTIAPSIGMQLVEALLRAIRSIGILEDYTTFTAALKEVWSLAVSAEAAGRIAIVHYATLLNICIPIAGSTLILGLFAEVFPRFQLWWRCLWFKRDKCYFSALNAQSLMLAKSILLDSKAEKKLIHPLLIFTDAYVDDESESSIELLLEAKRLGAVCLRDDLTHVPKARFGTRKYFLIEEDEYANMPALTGLLADHNIPYLKSAFIYLFVQSDLHVRLEQNIRQRLITGDYPIPEDKMPVVIPVNAHRNLVNNLMVEVPLYEPLVGTEKEELHVTILGNGSIGTEAFLSAYWFGQMLVKSKEDDLPKECAVTIHIVSQDTESAFWAKIDSVNPEIRCTTCDGTNCPRRKGDGNTPSECVRPRILHWREGQSNPRYCTVQYHQIEDVKIGALGHQDWLESDYVIVALGSDATNITVAEKLRTHIGKQHFERADALSHTVIAYVVYDSELCRALNHRTADGNTAENGIYMYAFGSLDQVYSSANVFMSKSRLLAEGMGKAYQQQSHVAEQKGRKADAGALYNTLADQARAMHVRYKLFSLGWVTTSLFDRSRDDHNKMMKELSVRYQHVVAAGMPENKQRESGDVLSTVPAAIKQEDADCWLDLQRKRHRLAWLEHRRWCAYTRTMGFRFTEAMRENMETQGNHKNMPLKLHTCLVEARKPMGTDTYIGWSLPEEADQKPKADAMPDPDKLWSDNALMDYLDYHHYLRLDAIYAVLAPKKSKEALVKTLGFPSCKRFDYYFGEFERYWTVDTFLAETKNVFTHMTSQRMKRWCARAKEGVFDYNGERYVPSSLLKTWIRKQYDAPLQGEDATVYKFDGAEFVLITKEHRRLVREKHKADQKKKREAKAEQRRKKKAEEKAKKREATF